MYIAKVYIYIYIYIYIYNLSPDSNQCHHDSHWNTVSEPTLTSHELGNCLRINIGSEIQLR